MNAHATASTSSTAGSHGCGCGCSCGCESQCCELECLVRPNFYCGQMVTDVDLDAIVDWTRRRLGLTRYRDGWGIVCGLQLSCSPLLGARSCCGDQTHGPAIYVRPGYAVDCCGNDLVVCEPLAVDLSGVCQPDDDPCAQPPKKPERAPQAQPQPQAPATNSLGLDSIWARCLGEGEVVPVDLFLRYREDLTHGQRPLFGGQCGIERSCEYARILERPCVYAERAIDRVPSPDPQKELEAKQAEAMEAVRAAVAGGARGVRDYLKRHPIAYLCFVEDLRCCYAETETRTRTGAKKDQEEAAKELDTMRLQLIRWLYHDWFLQQLECDCFSCKPDHGVPIGRVYLLRPERTDRECRVVLIDVDEAHRRPLSRDDCGATPEGRVDLRPFYRMEVERAASAMSHRGFNVKTASVDMTKQDLAATKPLAWMVKPDGDVVLKVAADPLGRNRVIAVEVPGNS